MHYFCLKVNKQCEVGKIRWKFKVCNSYCVAYIKKKSVSSSTDQIAFLIIKFKSNSKVV